MFSPTRVSLALLVIAMFAAAPSYADVSCSCSPIEDAATMADFNETIVVAQVLAADPFQFERPDGSTIRHTRYTVRVSRFLKGRFRTLREMHVETDYGWTCGYDMRVGGTYLIGMVQRGGAHFTNTCNGNAWLDAPDGQQYRDPEAWLEAVEEELAARSGESGGCGFGTPFGALQSIALLGLGAAIMRRRDRSKN